MQNVPLKKVVGCCHPCYDNRSWVRMLLNLSRTEVSTVSQAYNAIDNPLYQHDIVSFSKYGENYIISNGHHRACLAKFGYREFIQGKVTEYVLDVDAVTAYNYLSRYFKPSYRGACHYDFDSDFIKVMAGDRDELLNFYTFLYSWNYDATKKLKARQVLSNKINDFLFGWINRNIFHEDKTHMDKLREKKFIRWMSIPTETNILIALMELKLAVDQIDPYYLAAAPASALSQ